MQEYIGLSLLRIDRPKAKGNIFLHLLINSVNKSFIALLINPDNFIEEIDPTQQNSPAESSYEFTSTLLINRDYIYLS